MKVRIVDSRPAPESIRDLVTRLVRGHAPSIRVERQRIPYWQERGWVRNGNRYTGNYQTTYGAFQGSAEERSRSYFRFYIYHPPQALSRHSHWTCFIDRGGGTYEIHLSRQPADVGSGIMAIERLLTEALQNR